MKMTLNQKGHFLRLAPVPIGTGAWMDQLLEGVGNKKHNPKPPTKNMSECIQKCWDRWYVRSIVDLSSNNWGGDEPSGNEVLWSLRNYFESVKTLWGLNSWGSGLGKGRQASTSYLLNVDCPHCVEVCSRRSTSTRMAAPTTTTASKSQASLFCGNRFRKTNTRQLEPTISLLVLHFPFFVQLKIIWLYGNHHVPSIYCSPGPGCHASDLAKAT